MWDTFRKGMGKKIGNGNSTSFWFDNWSEINVPLIALIPGREGLIDKDDKVADYINQSGEWDRGRMNFWLPHHIVDRIICAHPPREERGEDKHFWKPSTDGTFSVRSAYHFLIAGTQRQEDNVWKLIWRWSVPEKIKSFIWLFTHGRAHTAQLRQSRGISATATCP